MEEQIIVFPERLNNDAASYEFLAQLQHEVKTSTAHEVLFDMTECSFYHALFTSFLGTMLHIANRYGKTANICTVRGSAVENYLKSSGLYSYVTGDQRNYTNRNSIPFFTIKSRDDEDVLEYVGKIIDHAPIKLTEQARELLFQNIFEIFCNAAEHSGEDMGVYACGHWMPSKRHLVFSIYDTGVGIPNLVKEKVKDVHFSEDALRWALLPGNSTKQLHDGVPRGLGLAKLMSFIKLNNGCLNIFSNDICFSFNKGCGNFSFITKPIIGTFIGITIVADKNHIYSTSKEMK